MRKDCTSIGYCVETEQGHQGFMLVGLIVAIFLVLLLLSLAAPKVSQELRREREVETVHRGDQYVRAIRLYYRKTGTYPASMDALEKTNNIRYLRQRYVDPMTGKDDWRMIPVGGAKTTVKGFFGQPLVGLAPGGIGSGGMGSGGIGSGSPGQSSSAPGAPGGGGLGSSSPGTGGLGSSSGSGSAFGSPSGGTSSFGTSPPGSTSGFGSQSSSSGSSGNTAPFVGVGVPKEGDSITVLNEQTTYNTWEFIYDPRIEQLYAKGALNGGIGSSGSGSSPGLGSTPSAPGSTPGVGSTTPTAPPTTPPQQ